jgi:hypothetical protein
MSASALHACRFLITASWMPLRWRVPSLSRFGIPRRMLLRGGATDRRREETRATTPSARMHTIDHISSRCVRCILSLSIVLCRIDATSYSLIRRSLHVAERWPARERCTPCSCARVSSVAPYRIIFGAGTLCVARSCRRVWTGGRSPLVPRSSLSVAREEIEDSNFESSPNEEIERREKRGD